VPDHAAGATEGPGFLYDGYVFDLDGTIYLGDGVRDPQHRGDDDPLMLEAAIELLGLEVGDCLMVGDRLSTDIAMARAAGMPSAVVLTGETTSQLLAATPPEDRPTWVLDRIDRLLPASP
jgi:ribonucleotide monophosphatase NagD (HAD superfamily)